MKGPIWGNEPRWWSGLYRGTSLVDDPEETRKGIRRGHTSTACDGEEMVQPASLERGGHGDVMLDVTGRPEVRVLYGAPAHLHLQ